MSQDPKTCDRCGSPLERGSVRLTATPIGDPGPAEVPSLDACRACGKSFSRWVDRGRSRTRPAAEPRPPRALRKPSRPGKFRPTREQVALGVVVLLGLLFGYYIGRD